MGGNNGTPLQEFQLARLRYALQRRPVATSKIICHLVDVAISSLYLSCIDAGVGGQARSMIDAYRRQVASGA